METKRRLNCREVAQFTYEMTMAWKNHGWLFDKYCAANNITEYRKIRFLMSIWNACGLANLGQVFRRRTIIYIGNPYKDAAFWSPIFSIKGNKVKIFNSNTDL